MSKVRKPAALLLVIALLPIILAGCIKKESKSKKTSVKREAPQEIVVGISKDINEPKYAEIGVLSPNANIYESLVKLTPDFKVGSLLATKWEYLDNNTWRFYLREGVKFHNGDEFTADAVKYTLEKAIRPSGTSILKIEEGSVKVVNEHTVDITTTEPNMRVPEILTHPLYGIRAEGVDPAKHPTGTGPFRYVSYQKDKQLIVESNQEYWGTLPKLEKLTFKYIPDPNSRVMALQAGEVDVITEVPREMVSQIKDTKDLQALKSQVGGAYLVFEIRVNGKSPQDIIKDKTIRSAVSYAIDRKTIVNEVWEGNAAVNQTWLPSEMLGKHKNLIKGFTHDPERAEAILDQAGWQPGSDGIRVKEGRRLELTIVSGWPSASALKPVPEIVQQQLKDVGIEVEIIEVSDEGVYDDLLRKGEGDLWLTNGNQNNADPTFGPQMLHHSEGYYGDSFDRPWWGGEEFDKLIDEARNTDDIDKATLLVAESLHLIIDEEVTLISVADLFNVYAAKEKIKSLTPHPADISTRWDKVYVAK